MANARCTAPGCAKPSRNKTGGALCPMHYHRQYRHGRIDAEANSSGITASYGRRYRSLYLPSHPLAAKHGKVYEHRAVLYDFIGPGPHPCYWCGILVDWVGKGQPGCLEADHLNHIGDDNRPQNLVPACRNCNIGRAADRRHAALVAAGWWSENDTVARLRDPRQRRRVA